MMPGLPLIFFLMAGLNCNNILLQPTLGVDSYTQTKRRIVVAPVGVVLVYSSFVMRVGLH